MKNFNIILFDEFETLDAFGPVEVIGWLKDEYKLNYFSKTGGIVVSCQHVKVETMPFIEIDTSGILLIPGGLGTRKLLSDEDFIEQLKSLSRKAPYVLTVCTGSTLLAKTGLLNGLKATSTKRVFELVTSFYKEVNWVKKARWVNDGKYYTSSGISAGIDMTLGFINEIHGVEVSKSIANGIEYIWNSDKDNDPFAVE